MIKGLLISILFISMSFTTKSQNLDTCKIGSAFEVPKFAYVSEILGEFDGKVYVKRIDEDINIDVFDKNMDRVKTSAISMKSDVKLLLLATYLVGNKILLFASGYDEEAKTRIIFGSILPVTASTYSPSWQKMLTVEDVGKYALSII